MMQLFVFMSEMLGRKVYDSDGCFAGKLCDVAMRISDEIYPRATVFVLRKSLLSKKKFYVPLEDVESTVDGIHLKVGAEHLKTNHDGMRFDFTLCDDILDQQIVDTNHQKVVRVNDAHMLRVDRQLYLAHVDVGLRGLVRRLEWTRFVDGLVRIIRPQSPYLYKDDLIPWKNTQVLSAGRYKKVLRLDVAQKKLSEIPPTDLAEIMEDLDIFEKHSLYKLLDVQTQRSVFTDLAMPDKQELIEQLNDQEIVSLLENIPADEATDLLTTLPKEERIQLMRGMQSEKSKKLRKLLGFAQDSAGGLMTTEYLSLKSGATVEDAMDLTKKSVQYPGNIFHIYIVDDQNRLLGSTSMRRFINADPKSPIVETCYPKNIFLKTDDGLEEIALLLEKYKFSSIPVVSEENIIQGVITSDDVMEELITLAWKKYKDKL